MRRSWIIPALTRLFAIGALLLFVVRSIAAQETSRLRVEGAPSVRIGTEGDIHSEFTRIASAIQLSDKSIAVVVVGSSDVRVFDPMGNHLRTFGRRGSGPGEYQQMHFVARAGDTLVLYDFGLRRLTSLDVRSGRVNSTTLTPATASPMVPVGRFDDGSLVMRESPTTSLKRRQGTRRDSLDLVVVSPRGNVVHRIGRFAGDAMFAFNPDNTESARAVLGHPLGPRLHVMMSKDRVGVADGTQRMVTWFDRRGRKTGTTSLPLEKRAYDENAVTNARDRLLRQGVPEKERALIAELFSRTSRGPEQPTFSTVHVSAAGDLWIARFSPDILAGPTDYLVVDSRGNAVGSVTLPAGFRVTEIGADYILGVRSDADRVESVEMYRYAR